MTPDEYCDTIRNIAFDRETTKAAFEAGRAAEAAERDQDLTIAYIDGHARGRESLRIELARQEAKAQPPDVRELVEALQEVVDAADGEGWAQLDPSFSKQRDALNKYRGKS